MTGVEVATKISELVATNPPGSDPKSEGDNHLRLIKGVLQDVFDDSGTTLKTTLPIESPPGAILADVTITGGATIDKLTAAKIDNPLNLVDPADKIRATIAATETAGTGGIAITAFDDGATPDQEAQLLIGTVLEYSGDDATKIIQIDQSRQATGTTRKIYVPAAPVDSVTGIWEPINVVDLTGKSTQQFIDLAAFRRLRLLLAFTNSVQAIPYIQVSVDNGANWAQASEYINSFLSQSGTSISGIAPTPGTSVTLASVGVDAGAVIPYMSTLEVDYFNKAVFSWFRNDAVFVSTGAVRREFNYGYRNVAPALNAFRLNINAGTWTSGQAILEGIRG